MPRHQKTPVESQPLTGRPALSPDARERQLIALAVDLAERQLREGTASAQVITHYLRLGTQKEKTEREILERQRDLLTAKTKAIESTQRTEELYANALEAMRRYAGNYGAMPDENL